MSIDDYDETHVAEDGRTVVMIRGDSASSITLPAWVSFDPDTTRCHFDRPARILHVVAGDGTRAHFFCLPDNRVGAVMVERGGT